MIKFCVVCSQKFSTIYSRQKYCSEKCYRQAKLKLTPKKTERRTCPTCGHVFQVVSTSEKKFCCSTCKVNFKPNDKKKTLEDWAKEARACGMTYGKYRAAVEHFGKTFDELKRDVNNEI